MKTASDPRHQERQKIVQDLFAWDAHQRLINKTPSPTSQKTQAVIDHIDEINALTKICAPEWDLGRINQIDLAILRLGIYELVIEPTAPAKVVIDESIELAKEFGSETSPSFLNGALGKALLTPERIKRVISVRLGVDADKLTDDANLEHDLNATDLELSDLFTHLEKDYNLTFLPDPKITTVGELQAYIEDQAE